MKLMNRALAAAISGALALAPIAALAEKGDAFQPQPQATVNLSADGSGENVAVAVHGQVRLYNSGSVTAFCRIETGTTGASASTDFPLAGGEIEVMTGVGDHIACITAGGSTTLYFTPGVGV